MYKVIKYERDNDGWYVGLKRSQDRKIYWVEVWIANNDVEANWNQYIFSTINSDDIHRNKVQENCDEFDSATSEAIDYLEMIGELIQNRMGEWLMKK